MPRDLLTQSSAVHQAMDEYDTMGGDEFLRRYGFGPAKWCFVLRDGKRYPSKAIYGVAVGKEHPERGPLTSNDFSGGESTVIRSLRNLGFEVDTGGGEEPAMLRVDELERLRESFLRYMNGFSRFGDGGEYDARERAYKDELRQVFAAEVLPRAEAPLTSAGEAVELTNAYYRTLTAKLAFNDNSPQNLINWQVYDWLKPADLGRSEAIGRALHALLADDGDRTDRLGKFINTVGTALRDSGGSGPYGIARLIGSCALMLQDPSTFVAIRTDVWKTAVETLTGAKFPSHSDEIARVRVSLDLADQIFAHMAQEWRWEPRDFIDVQSFLWVALMYKPEDATDQFANYTRRILQRLSEIRNGPFREDPELWAAMNGLKDWVRSAAPVQTRPNLIVNWSVGKGNWATIPWLAIMDQRVTTTTQEGVYVVMLISRDLQSVYLTLAQGITAVVNAHGGREGVRILSERAATLRSMVPELTEAGIELSGEIDLGADARLANSYEAGRIAHVRLDANSLPNDAEFSSYLAALLSAYDKVVLPSDDTAREAAASALPYTIDDALADLFMDRAAFERMLAIWQRKKNMILQGAPGVGKTFVARRLAYALMGEKDLSRVETVQFHQSYGYEDFIQGYRPTLTGGFSRTNGTFFRFCERAAADGGRPYVFIIDEINRGNLSKVFGELMMLVESDKRGPDWRTTLAYSSEEDQPFFVPDNVLILGMMNTADRSLSLVDYALRRRFAFVSLKPAFDDPKFRAHLRTCGVANEIVDRTIERMTELNAAIAADKINLGPGFQIGHSFFVPANGSVNSEWYSMVVQTEIRPLLEEYWFDEPARADEWCGRLLAP